MATESDIARLYTDACAGFDELVRTLDATAHETPVPCTPGWNVHDVVAHIVGAAEDITSGRVDGAGSEAWSAAQVDRCRQRSVIEMLDSWRPLVPEVGSLLTMFEEIRPPIDVYAHEHDIRHAVATPGHRDSEIVALAGFGLIANLDVRRAVRVEWDDGSAIEHAGDGEPLVLRGVTPFELFRSRLGRRSRRQVAAYDWSEDPGEALDAWFAFGPATSDIDEG